MRSCIAYSSCMIENSVLSTVASPSGRSCVRLRRTIARHRLEPATALLAEPDVLEVVPELRARIGVAAIEDIAVRHAHRHAETLGLQAPERGLKIVRQETEMVQSDRTARSWQRFDVDGRNVGVRLDQLDHRRTRPAQGDAAHLPVARLRRHDQELPEANMLAEAGDCQVDVASNVAHLK